MKAGLRFKAAIVGTRFEPAAKLARWALNFRFRSQNPHMWEVFLEDRLWPTILKKVLREDSNIVDVGCHIGSFANLASRYAPRGGLILIEPVPSKCELLRSKFPRATVHQMAIADVTGSAIFEENLKRSGFSRLRGNHPSSAWPSYEVIVNRLDDIVSARVNLLKIDVEGNELEVLRGAECLIKRDSPVVIFECGAENSLQAIGKTRRQLYDFITGTMGYSVFTFSDYIFEKGPLGEDEFRKCGIYPFRAFNFIAVQPSTCMPP